MNLLSDINTQLGFGAELSWLLLGDISAAVYIAGMIFSFIGMGVRKIYQLTKRNVDATHSPKELRGDFWWRHNKYNVILNVLFILLIMRFYPELAKSLFPSFFEVHPMVTMYVMLLVGLFLDIIVQKSMYAVKSKSYQQLSNDKKDVGFLLFVATDRIVSIDGVEYGQTADELCNTSADFWLQKNKNGDLFLCTKVAKTIVTITAKISKENGLGGNKSSVVISSDFICDQAGNCEPPIVK